MTTEVRSFQRCCASCEYWAGERHLKPNSSGQIFVVENFLDARNTAPCACGASRFCSRNMPANNVVCDKYTKWHALK